MALLPSMHHALTFPEHMILVGRTLSGKSLLVGEIFSNIDQVYKRRTKDNIVVVLSPHEAIEISLNDITAQKTGQSFIFLSILLMKLYLVAFISANSDPRSLNILLNSPKVRSSWKAARYPRMKKRK